MKKLVTLVCFIITLSSAWAQSLTSPPSSDNQKSKVTQFIGLVEVSITYSSPDVHSPNGKIAPAKSGAKSLTLDLLIRVLDPPKQHLGALEPMKIQRSRFRMM